MLNNAAVQGRLCADPDLRHTQSGVPVCSFRIAWSEKYKDTETQCFLDCTAWRNTGEFISKYFVKGQEIVVEGKLVTQKWEDKDGNKRTSIKLDIEKAHFCGAKKDSGGQNYADGPGIGGHGDGLSSPVNDFSTSGGGDFAEVNDDDELPF